MRGLTTEERRVLVEALELADNADGDDATADWLATEDRLIEQQRATLIAREDEDYEWRECFATDLGRLALRVCPTEEA